MARRDREDEFGSWHPGDGRVFDLLRSHGDPLNTPRPVDHYLYFPTQATARKAAELLQEEGYSVEVSPGAKRGTWLTLASHRLAPTEEAIARARREMEILAESLKGEYDGWETEILPSPM